MNPNEKLSVQADGDKVFEFLCIKGFAEKDFFICGLKMKMLTGLSIMT